MVVKRLVEEIADGRPDSELGKVEETEEVLQRAGEADKIGTQGVKEYFTRKETQRQRQEVKYKVDAGVKQCFLYA